MGSWSLTLRPDTPKTIREAVSTPFQSIIITPTWVDPTGMTDAAMLDLAIYNGVVLRPGPQYELGGVGLAWWLGDERGVPYIASPVSSTSGASLASWVSSLIASTPISVGSVTGAGPVGGNVAGYFQWQSARTALEAVLRYFQVEYRVNNDYTIDYGEPADLYGATPVATALPRGQGSREQRLKGFEVTDLDYSRDFADYVSFVTAVGRGGYGQSSSVNILTEFGASDPVGDAVSRRAFFDVPEASLGLEVNYAESVLDRYSEVDFVGVSTDDFVRGTFGPGYYLNVYDSDRGLLDADNQDVYQGEVVFPKLVRVIGMTWPIQDGCGVYYRFREDGPSGDAIYTDLSPYVERERPGTKIEVGTSAYSPINDQFTVSAQTATVQAGAWDQYTPSITGTGTAVGNGTVVGKYRRVGTTLHIRITWTLGSTSTVGSGGVTFSLPSGMSSPVQTNAHQMVEAMYNDTGTVVYKGHAYVGSGGTTLLCNVWNVAGTYPTWTGLTSAIPHTWANTDFININGTIEVAV